MNIVRWCGIIATAQGFFASLPIVCKFFADSRWKYVHDGEEKWAPHWNKLLPLHIPAVFGRFMLEIPDNNGVSENVDVLLTEKVGPTLEKVLQDLECLEGKGWYVDASKKGEGMGWYIDASKKGEGKGWYVDASWKDQGKGYKHY